MKKHTGRGIIVGHDGVQYLVHALMATATPTFLAHIHPDITAHRYRLRAYCICRIILANRNA